MTRAILADETWTHAITQAVTRSMAHCDAQLRRFRKDEWNERNMIQLVLRRAGTDPLHFLQMLGSLGCLLYLIHFSNAHKIGGQMPVLLADQFEAFTFALEQNDSETDIMCYREFIFDGEHHVPKPYDQRSLSDRKWTPQWFVD